MEAFKFPGFIPVFGHVVPIAVIRSSFLVTVSSTFGSSTPIPSWRASIYKAQGSENLQLIAKYKTDLKLINHYSFLEIHI